MILVFIWFQRVRASITLSSFFQDIPRCQHESFCWWFMAPADVLQQWASVHYSFSTFLCCSLATSLSGNIPTEGAAPNITVCIIDYQTANFALNSSCKTWQPRTNLVMSKRSILWKETRPSYYSNDAPYRELNNKVSSHTKDADIVTGRGRAPLLQTPEIGNGYKLFILQYIQSCIFSIYYIMNIILAPQLVICLDLKITCLIVVDE